MYHKKHAFLAVVVIAMVSSLILTGCSASGKYKTKPDYSITEQVAMSFMDAYMNGDADKALEYIAEDCVLSTDTGDMKGKQAVAELIKLNNEKQNKMAVSEKNRIEDSTIMLIVDNTIPLFQLAGIENVKTRERIEVQDSLIVKWEVKYLKESVDYIEQAASGATGLDVEVKDGSIIVRNVIKKSPADYQGIKPGDIIESINGTTLKDMKYGAEEIPYRLIGQVGSRVEIVLSREAETRTVKLTRVSEKDFK